MPIILIVSFIGVLVVSSLIIGISIRPSATQKVMQERLQTIKNAKKTESTEYESAELAPRAASGFLDAFGESLRRYRFAEQLQVLIDHSGSSSTVGAFVVTSAGLAIVMGGLAHFLVGATPLVVVGTLVGGAAQYFLLKMKKAKRLKAFNTALPDAIELMARALRAGHSMSSSIEIIAEQSAEPLASEFSSVYQQQKFGIPFRDALLELGERVPSKDLHFLVTAVLVQKETGGDLTEILDRTTHVIRERVRIEGEIRTYTAQGRLTGWILGLLPVIMLGLINIMTPGYSTLLFHDPVGQKLLYVGGGLIIVGGLIIRKIVNIEV